MLLKYAQLTCQNLKQTCLSNPGMAIDTLRITQIMLN